MRRAFFAFGLLGIRMTDQVVNFIGQREGNRSLSYAGWWHPASSCDRRAGDQANARVQRARRQRFNSPSMSSSATRPNR